MLLYLAHPLLFNVVLVPGNSAGMVCVMKNGCTEQVLLKGFNGFVRDLSFAFHEKRILVAAVDEYGYLLVHEIVESTAHLILQVNPDENSTSSDCHRVIWCPYVPESLKNAGKLCSFVLGITYYKYVSISDEKKGKMMLKIMS